jgi:hypothetical protein
VPNGCECCDTPGCGHTDDVRIVGEYPDYKGCRDWKQLPENSFYARKELAQRQKEKMAQTDYDYCEEVKTTTVSKTSPLDEIELIQVFIENLPHLKKAAAKRVLDYAQRIFDDTFGKDKVYR